LGYIEAVLNLAQLKLKEKDHTIYAAFSGRLSRFKLQVGDIITANTAILNLSSSKYLIAELGVIDSDIKRIELGTKAEFTFESTKVFGTVISISDQIEKESLLCRVDVLIENEKNIPNGKFIKMYIHSKKRPKQLLVPKEAVINRDQKEIIFIARDNKAIWCYVETGKSNNEYIEVLSNQMNLQEGEPIIVDGQFTLAHQSDIEIRNRIE
jgi:RND family efflux transporter MFP subunit